MWHHLLYHNALIYWRLARLPLCAVELEGVFSYWPGNDQALLSLISALSVMTSARLLLHSLKTSSS